MTSNDERKFFNQNLMYHKDILYNSGGTFEINISNSTTDYKSFSPPVLHISIIGDNNIRRVYPISFPNSVELFTSIKDVISNIESIYTTGRSNTIVKKYHYDKSLKIEFIQIQNSGDRVVTISIVLNSSDFSKVVIPYSVFSSFFIGILKYFVSDFVNLTLSFSNRSLLTEMLECNKQSVNLLKSLPSHIFESEQLNIKETETIVENTNIVDTINDFEQFLGDDMKNISVPELDSKVVLEEKKKIANSGSSLLISKTLTNDLSVLESMLNASITRTDPLLTILEGFRRSMNLETEFSFMPRIPTNDLKSLLYISKIFHDYYVNSYLTKDVAIPSGFSILKYGAKREDLDEINLQICYDLLLIFAFVKIFRGKIESKQSDANLNGSLFYLRLRTFLDPLVYSFLDPEKANLISSILMSNFDLYESNGFFSHYQDILVDYGFSKISNVDIKEFCNELNMKVFQKDVLNINISQKHEEYFKSGFLKINSDNNLSKEQIINEVISLEILEKNGIVLDENNEDLKKIFDMSKLTKEVKDIFFSKKVESKEKESNLLKTVNFYNNEIPKKVNDEFLNYIVELKYDIFDFNKFEMEEFGENIVKAIYVWNESLERKELYTVFREKLESNILTKDLIISKYKNTTEKAEVVEEWMDINLG